MQFLHRLNLIVPDYSEILTKIKNSIKQFNRNIPDAQKAMFEGIQEELRRLDLRDGNIKATVANLRILNSIKNKLNRIILSEDYVKELKAFVKSFNELTTLQNEYWRSIEKDFKPRPLLREIRKQAITDTVTKLGEAGIGANISDKITDILRTNITSGGSYKKLENQLRESLTDTQKSDGILTKYAKQITTDSINQYARNYNQIVSSDLGFEWYSYRGTEIMTSRPFCQAMVENNRYYHISQIPNLLKGLDALGNKLQYIDNLTNETKKVELYAKTNLPHGFKEGTNVANFFTLLGGHSCGHQSSGVSERIVPLDVREKVFSTAQYKAWKQQQ